MMLRSKSVLCIRGLSESDSESDIYQLLSKYGTLTQLEIIKPKDNKGKKNALAHYQLESQANFARSSLHNQKIGSNYLFVDYYDPYSKLLQSGAYSHSEEREMTVKKEPKAEKKIIKFTEVDKDRKNEKTTLYTKKNLEKMMSSGQNSRMGGIAQGVNGFSCNPAKDENFGQSCMKTPVLTQNYYINGTMNNQQNVYLKSQINFIQFMPFGVGPNAPNIEQIKQSYLEKPCETGQKQGLIPPSNRGFYQRAPQSNIAAMGSEGLLNPTACHNISQPYQNSNQYSNPGSHYNPFPSHETNINPAPIINVLPPNPGEKPANDLSLLPSSKESKIPEKHQKKQFVIPKKFSKFKKLIVGLGLQQEFDFGQMKDSDQKKKLRRLYHKLLHKLVTSAHKTHSKGDDKESRNECMGLCRHKLSEFHKCNHEGETAKGKEKAPEIEKPVVKDVENQEKNLKMAKKDENLGVNQTIANSEGNLNKPSETNESKEKSMVIEDPTPNKNEERPEEKIKMEEEKKVEQGGEKMLEEELLKNKKVKGLLNYVMNGGDISLLYASLKRKGLASNEK